MTRLQRMGSRTLERRSVFQKMSSEHCKRYNGFYEQVKGGTNSYDDDEGIDEDECIDYDNGGNDGMASGLQGMYESREEYGDCGGEIGYDSGCER